LGGRIGEERQRDAEDRAAAVGRPEIDDAAVVLDDLVRERQAEPGPGLLGAEERVEHAIGGIGCDSHPAVLDLDLHTAAGAWATAARHHDVFGAGPAHAEHEPTAR